MQESSRRGYLGSTLLVCRAVAQPHIDRVSVPSPIAIEKLMVRNGEGQSSHVLVFSVNFEMSEIISFILNVLLMFI